ncbi:MAG TPA: fucose isomerase, partial [bacterium]|nr:fucose isomerase [bacterium]
DRPVVFGVMVGTRGFFNPKLARDGRRALLARLSSLGYEYVIPPEEATPTGALETRSDAQVTARAFQAARERIDGIIVTLPNFGDETGIVQALQMARLDVPVLVHAFDDDIDKVGVSQRRDAFCGKISVTCNLTQYGIPWTDTSLHSCPVDGPELTADLERFARVCRVVRGLREARVGAIGARPGAFQTVRYSEKLLLATGLTVVPVDLSEILSRAERLPEADPEVKAKLGVIHGYGRIPDRIPPASVVKQARLSVTIDRWMEENQCVASAIQCWESVQMNYGCATCLSMSLMGEQRRMPSACEVDVSGAVSMYALTLASGNASALLDWNNNYGADRDKCVATHCSNYPKSFVGSEIEISELDILGETLGRDKCFGAIKGKVAAGPMTFFRMDTNDREARLQAYVGEGEFTSDSFAMDGGIAVCRITGLRELLRHVTRGGFAHHVAMVRSRCADVLHEATLRYLRWDTYRHGEGAREGMPA